jgi:hypothetical protein
MSDNKRPPIVLFVYNRIQHLKRVVESLLLNQSANLHDLLIYSDGPKSISDSNKINELRSFLYTIEGFASVKIICRTSNLGLSNSLVSGISEVLNLHSSVIICEDDVCVSPVFLDFMTNALNIYYSNPNVYCISGYVYPTEEKLPENFFIRGADCWGWGTWRRAWDHFENDGEKLLNEIKNNGLIKKFNFNGSVNYYKMLKLSTKGKLDSWAVKWHASVFLKNGLTLYPSHSLVNNIGMDGSGVHSGNFRFLDCEINSLSVKIVDIPVEHSELALNSIINFFKKKSPSFFSRLKNYVFIFKKQINKLL